MIDTSTNAVTATITVGSHPAGVAITLDATKAYVANGVTAGWEAGHSGSVPPAGDGVWKLMHAEDIEKVRRFYRSWVANQQWRRCITRACRPSGIPMETAMQV